MTYYTIFQTSISYNTYTFNPFQNYLLELGQVIAHLQETYGFKSYLK